MLSSQIALRSDYSKAFIFTMKARRYLQTGVLLHLMGIAGLFLFFVFMEKAYVAFQQQSVIWTLIHSYLTIHCLTLPFFSQFDARSRYQNYKMLKDKLYTYGFDERIIRPFVFSRCQRDAVRVAAAELHLASEFKTSVYKMGFRWYHILPHMVLKSPGLLFTKSYWQKTLFVKAYKSQYFLW